MAQAGLGHRNWRGGVKGKRERERERERVDKDMRGQYTVVIGDLYVD